MPQDEVIHFLEERLKRLHLPFMPVIWGITCVILAGLIVIGLFSYKSAEKAIARQYNEQQLFLARQAARSVEDFFQNIREISVLAARLPEVQNHESGIDEKVLRSLFDRFQGRIKFLFLEDRRGVLTSAYRAGNLKEARQNGFTSRSVFQEIRGQGKPVAQVVSLPGPGAPGERADLVLIAAPIYRRGEFAGVLGCALDVTEINKRFILPVRSGVAGGAWMIDGEGRFIGHFDRNFQGRNAFTARQERDPDFPTEGIDRIMREEMLKEKSGINEYTVGSHRGLRGATKKLIAYAPVRFEGQIWSLAVVIPYSEVTQIVWDGFRNSVWLLVIMGFTLLTGTYVGHKINQGRVRAEEKARWGQEIVNTQNRLQALFDGAPDAITMVDRSYRVAMLNKTGLLWGNRPLEEIVGKPCYAEFQGRVDLCPNCPAEESFRTGQPAFRQRASLLTRGKKRYVQLFTFPLLDRHGNVTEVVEYVKDVTAEKELQQQMIQSERLAVVGRMSANVAHEIKNPLGTIVLNADLLEEELEHLEGQEKNEARNLLAVIKSELDHLIDVVDEYLQFARLPQVKLESGNVNEVISDLLQFLREEVAGRNIMVVEDLESSLPPIQMDPKQLRQALLNIVKNSFEAMAEGGKLTISTSRQNGHVQINIADTGRGIPEENAELVFTPFFSTKHGGTGLGLPITTHIIQEHHGTVNFESFVGLGTIFTIRLPVPEADASENSSRPGPPDRVAAAGTLGGETVG